jgi:hypothetical protein
MFSPATKGWIQKYLELYNEKVINADKFLSARTIQELHAQFVESGLIFGFASSFLIYKDIDTSRLTNEEQLKLLLFEAMLIVYSFENKIQPVDTVKFIDTLTQFYKNQSTGAVQKLFSFFIKESVEERLESIFAKRVAAPQNIFESTLAINNFSNAFIYLDIIQFHDFITHNSVIETHEDYAMLAMKSVILAAKSDNEIESREKVIFNVFLNSIDFSNSQEKNLSNLLEESFELNDLEIKPSTSWVAKRYILELAALLIYSKNEIEISEKTFLDSFTKKLGFEVKDLDEIIIEVQRFVLQHEDKIHFLQDASGIEKYYSGVSEKFVKVLGRNKDKLAVELSQSKELVNLISKSTTRELTKEEKAKVKTQFKDLVKSVPALAIFLLPGGAVLLPILLKVIPSLVPSAFRSNELNDDSKK